MWRDFKIALGLVVAIIVMSFVSPAKADQPPRAMFEHITATAVLKHQGQCNVKSLKLEGVDCLIYDDETNKVFYVVTFTANNKGVTYVIAVSKTAGEKILWQAFDTGA